LSPWGVLGIETTSDQTLIKKAYARRLKQHHPEDDPTGYQNLREAYDSAVQWAKFNLDSADESNLCHDGSESLNENLTHSELVKNTHGRVPFNTIEDVNRKSEELSVNLLEGFMTKVRENYEDTERRMLPCTWETLFQETMEWPIDMHVSLYWEITEFVFENHHFPSSIWMLLDHHIGWLERLDDLHSCYDSDFIEYLKHSISVNVPFEYRVAETLSNPYEYFELREELYNALVSRKDPALLSDLIRSLESLCPSDADLSLLKGWYLLRHKTNSKAISEFQRYMEKKPGNISGLLFIAARLESGNVDKDACRIAERVLREEPNNIEGMLILAACYRRGKKLKEAKNICIRMYTLKPNDVEVNKSIDAVRLYMKLKLSRYPWLFSLRDDLEELCISTGLPMKIERVTISTIAKRGVFKIYYLLLLSMLIAAFLFEHSH